MDEMTAAVLLMNPTRSKIILNHHALANDNLAINIPTLTYSNWLTPNRGALAAAISLIARRQSWSALYLCTYFTALRWICAQCS